MVTYENINTNPVFQGCGSRFNRERLLPIPLKPSPVRNATMPTLPFLVATKICLAVSWAWRGITGRRS